MKKSLSARDLKRFLSSLNDTSRVRYVYCYQIGSTFIALSHMERTIIHAMGMCDRIKMAEAMEVDATNAEKFIKKFNSLQDSTLGNLIKILSKHHILDADLHYLKWLKNKRDFFIHRWFRDDIWPGEMSVSECQRKIRSLLYLEIVFQRAMSAIWDILGRADLIAIQSLGSDGSLMINPDAMIELFDDDWRDAAVTIAGERIARQGQQGAED